MCTISNRVNKEDDNEGLAQRSHGIRESTLQASTGLILVRRFWNCSSALQHWEPENKKERIELLQSLLSLRSVWTHASRVHTGQRKEAQTDIHVFVVQGTANIMQYAA